MPGVSHGKEPTLRADSDPHGTRTPLNMRKIRELHKAYDRAADLARQRLEQILEDDNAGYTEWLAAIKEANNRYYGQAPSFSVVQGLVEHQHQHSFNAQALESMSPEQLEHLESTLASIVEVPEAEEVDPEDGNES